MSANTIISPPGLVPDLAPVTRSTAAGAPLASLCLLFSDLIALSAVFWLAVWSKSTFSHNLDLKFYVEAFPAVVIFLGVFSFQGLYPGMLLHPAEEMRASSTLLQLSFSYWPPRHLC